MRDQKIEIRPAENRDCEDIYIWRSDPLSRSMFFCNSIPSLKEHADWFESSLMSVNRKFYIGEVDSLKIGVCRFDYNKSGSVVEVSINMSPSSRGRGLGKRFLALCIEHYRKDHCYDLSAKIKPENCASMKIFKALGFRLVSTNKDVVTLFKTCKKLVFREVSEDDSEVLFDLLKRRVYSISHKNIPTKEEHFAFVKGHPYRYWFMILEDGCPVGTFYLQEDNSIGLNVLEPSLTVVSEVLRYVREGFNPYNEVKSKVPPYFYINVPYENEKLREILLQSDAKPIQVSYKT